jgi:glycosyl transferase family 87
MAAALRGPGRPKSEAAADSDRRPPILFWLPIALLPTLVWLFVLPIQAATGPPFLDWDIYRHGFDLWRSTGTPYEVLPPGWDPFVMHPYLYPPTSWPLMLVAIALPAAAAGLGALPLLLRPPRLRLVPVSAVLLILGLGTALYLGNVNLFVAGLIVAAFRPGRSGGLAFGALVGIKLYPIVLLPLLWADRTRLRWALAVIAVLLVSGTLFFGIAGWRDFLTTLLNEGPHPDISFNPFTDLGLVRLLPSGLIVLAGLAIRSPTVTLVGATWASGVVTWHYLITFAAALAVEPPLSETRRHAALLPATIAALRARLLGRPTAQLPSDAPSNS